MSTLPIVMRKFVIGDIHGCSRTFRSLVEQNMKLTTEDELYLLGDYVDRGPDSKGVIDYIFELRSSGFSVYCIKGNHEELMLQSEKSANDRQRWLINGGRETLKSFGVDSISEIDEKYIQFLESLDYYLEIDNFLLVHGGFNFKVEDPFKDFQSMMWIRYFEVDDKILKGRIILHGHTPMELEEIRWQNSSQGAKTLCLDAGCVYNKRWGMGHLCGVELKSRELYHEKYMEATDKF